MWCIAIQQLRHAVAKRVKDIIVAVTGLIDTVNARFASSTIEYEAIAAFGAHQTPIVLAHMSNVDTLANPQVQESSWLRFLT